MRDECLLQAGVCFVGRACCLAGKVGWRDSLIIGGSFLYVSGCCRKDCFCVSCIWAESLGWRDLGLRVARVFSIRSQLKRFGKVKIV
jgi:hypothetical protein